MCNLMVKSKGNFLFRAPFSFPTHFITLSQRNFPWLILTSHSSFILNKQRNREWKIVAPKEVVLLDSNGNKMTNNIIGPLEEGSDQVIFCESFGKFTHLLFSMCVRFSLLIRLGLSEVYFRRVVVKKSNVRRFMSHESLTHSFHSISQFLFNLLFSFSIVKSYLIS